MQWPIYALYVIILRGKVYYVLWVQIIISIYVVLEVLKHFLSPTMHKMYVHAFNVLYKVWLSLIYLVKSK